ncbi:MAG: homogentisate 1,2-dioxygenase [Alphaproteobacteria bacterium]|nr:homogentisate 1,2-dioxygenase [Alphaproteobacteria bacterium]
MMERIVRGEVPEKHHIAFRGDDGALRWEECFTRAGFDGPYSILYHLHRPHEQRIVPAEHGWSAPEPVTGLPLAKRHFKTQDLVGIGGPPVDAHVPLLFNRDVTIAMVLPDAEDPVYVVNADADDLYWVFEGGGRLVTPFGELRFTKGDYVRVPRGCIHRFVPDSGPQRWLHFECTGPVSLLKQWRNAVGQLTMDAPYCHRDFVKPTFVGPVDEGIRTQIVKRNGQWTGFALRHSPLDVVGWDGAEYPWVFPILKFQPRAGLVHLPPTWHGTFGIPGALICSFVPRAVDFHRDAIPCPYPHSSVDVDEFLFYAEGNFTSRRGVSPGSVSYHPAGIPHGPHPGAYEASIGHRETNELAVMLDCFEPLIPTRQAAGIEDPGYHDSFIEG